MHRPRASELWREGRTRRDHQQCVLEAAWLAVSPLADGDSDDEVLHSLRLRPFVPSTSSIEPRSLSRSMTMMSMVVTSDLRLHYVRSHTPSRAWAQLEARA